MHDRRGSLLDLLRMRGSATVDELASELQLTRTTIVNHLRLLMGEGLVKRAGLRRSARRPNVLYALTVKADDIFPQLYQDFSNDILEELTSEHPNHLKRIIAGVSKRWVARDLASVSNLRGPRRIQAALAVIAERGFMPALEGTPSNRVLHQYHCPLRSLCHKQPAVRELIRRWMQSLLGVSLERTGCTATGGRACAYALTRTA